MQFRDSNARVPPLYLDMINTGTFSSNILYRFSISLYQNQEPTYNTLIKNIPGLKKYAYKNQNFFITNQLPVILGPYADGSPAGGLYHRPDLFSRVHS